MWLEFYVYVVVVVVVVGHIVWLAGSQSPNQELNWGPHSENAKVLTARIFPGLHILTISGDFVASEAWEAMS